MQNVYALKGHGGGFFVVGGANITVPNSAGFAAETCMCCFINLLFLPRYVSYFPVVFFDFFLLVSL